MHRELRAVPGCCQDGGIVEQTPRQTRVLSFGPSSLFFFFFFNSQINVKGATAPAEVCSNPTRGQRGRAEFLQEPENIFLF